MTLFEADVTEIFPLTWDAEAIMAALYAHFDAVSSRFSIDGAGNGTPTGADGFLITPDDPDENFQVCFRRTSASEIKLSIEPSGALTDAGDASIPPTGASSDFSSERPQSLVNAGVGSKCWVIEASDAFFVLVSDTTNLSFVHGFHVGRTWQPWDANDADLGRDGLAVLVGQATSSSWLNLSDSYLHDSTNLWGTTRQSTTNNELTNTNIVKPLPTLACLRTGSYGTAIGFHKYLRNNNSARSDMTRYEADGPATNQAWIHIDNYLVVPWVKGITP